MIETRYYLGPVVVRMRRANDNLDVRVELPQALNGLQAVPARRHAHIDECHRVRLLLLERLLDPRHTLLTLQGRVDLESRARRGPGRLAQQQALGLQQLATAAGVAAQDLQKVLVDRLVVIHHEHSRSEVQGVTSHVYSQEVSGEVRERKLRRSPDRDSRHATRRQSPWQRVLRCVTQSRDRSSWL